jgi:hypothetical protein
MNIDEIDEQLNTLKSFQKFSDSDSIFLRDRKIFSEELGEPNLFDYIDQFGVYAGSQTIASRLQAYEVVKLSIPVPGHIVEFGVWHGSNLLFMAKVLKLFQPNTTKLVFGFDNFSGLPDATSIDGKDAACLAGKYEGNEWVLRKAIKLHKLEEWVHLIKGDATKTISSFEKSFPEAMISLAWVDFDLYEPCKSALDFLSRRLSVGGVIVLDEAISRLWPGETIAMLEFLENSGGSYRMEANTIGRQPVMFLVKES